MEALRHLPHYTFEDYKHWEGKWELWRGIAVAMSPSAGFGHGNFVLEIGARLRQGLEAEACRDCHITSQTDWKVEEDLVLRPDIAIVCGDRPTMHIEQTPTLIVEVLSPATHLRDRNEKRDICDREGVRHYLLADPEERILRDMRTSEQPELHRLDLHDGCTVELPSQWKPRR